MTLVEAISKKVNMVWAMFLDKSALLTFGLAHKWGLTAASQEHKRIDDRVVEICIDLINQRKIS